MTRKHFVTIARIISETEGMKNPETVRRHIAREIAAVCREANRNFDVDRFMAACDVEV